MDKEPKSFRSVTNEEELQRAKWFKEDLEKDKGWTEVAKNPWSTYWMKTLRDTEVPIKTLFTFDFPFPTKVFPQFLHPQNQQARKDWDKTFFDHKVLEAYPGGQVTYSRLPTSWPLTDRSFVLYSRPATEVDWYGKRALFMFTKHVWHPSKPVGSDGLVRATNGGNFYVVTPDEDQPEAACRVFGLTNNNYNGWLPSRNLEWMLKRAVPSKFNLWRESMVDGYNRYFKSG